MSTATTEDLGTSEDYSQNTDLRSTRLQSQWQHDTQDINSEDIEFSEVMEL